LPTARPQHICGRGAREPATYTFLAIFGVVLSTLVVPLPEELALLWAGWVSHGSLPVVLAGVAAFLGVMVGDAASFLLGRTVLPRFLETRLGKRMINPRMRKWGEDFVKRHGFRAVLLGRFLVALRGPVYLAIGAAKFSAARFFALNAAVGAIEVGIVVGLGYQFGASKDLAHDIKWICVIVAVVMGIALFVPIFVRRRFERGAASAAS
jgi:membrane protein DedA with SNARE-associated domain